MIVFWICVFIVALAGLVKGADWLLHSAERLGKAAHLSSFLVGTIILGFGTSLPELVSSIFGSLRGVPEIVVANVIGSNIANILLVLGAATALGGSLALHKRLSKFNISALVFSTLLYVLMALDRVVSFREALLLCLSFATYLGYTLRQQNKERAIESDRPHYTFKSRDVFQFIIGLVALVVGARYVVDATVQIAHQLDIATSILSAVFIALGTSLPELAVSVRAMQKGHGDIAFGNVFGSSIFNLLLVTGIPGLITRLPIDAQTYLIGLPALAIVAALTITVSHKRKLSRSVGVLSILGYAVFISLMFGLDLA
ncbi:MAG: calcium/sodium antiporter [bacterium]|nr:calcium/sodium antiporter [bacterium]